MLMSNRKPVGSQESVEFVGFVELKSESAVDSHESGVENRKEKEAVRQLSREIVEWLNERN